MTAPAIKVTYFDIRGRAEPIRLALVVGGLEFEDERVDFDSWPAMKPKTPYGALPILSVDGKIVAQSNAILRYVGKMTKLYPECMKMGVQVDEVMDAMEDLLMATYKNRGEDEEKVRETRVDLVENVLPKLFGGIEKRVALFGDGPFVTGEDVSVADLLIVNYVHLIRCGVLDHVPKDAVDGYSGMIKIYDGVMNIPKVAQWYKDHPVNVM